MTADNDTPAIGAEKHYQTQLQAGIFTIQKCTACQQSIFYPRMICPHCGNDTLQWYQPSGKATVYSTTVVRRKAEHGGDYNVALVDLDEGPRLMTRVEDIEPDAVQIGLAVIASIRDTDEGKLLVFTPQGAAK